MKIALVFRMIMLATLCGAGCGAVLPVLGYHTPSRTFAPKRAASDPELEAKMLAYLQGWTRVRQTYEVAVLQNDHWAPLRHHSSGVVVGRVRAVSAGARWRDGHCTFQDFELAQGFDGQSFIESLEMYGVGQQWEVTCATLEAARTQQ